MTAAGSGVLSEAGEYSKLRWRSRRGMRELDTLLAAFLAREYGALTAEERLAFTGLLDLPDPQLYAWLLGTEQATSPQLQALVERIRARRPL